MSIVGKIPSKQAYRSIDDHTVPGENPWLIIGSGSYGVLAAFEDRLLIVKGWLTSGRIGGGGTTVFPYYDIITIEYDSGYASGALQIITSSHRGFKKGKYRSSDAQELPNVLPLSKLDYRQALPHLNTLRSKIAEAKRPAPIAVQMAPTAAATPGLASELTRLATLRQRGVLSDAEFEAAKRTLLGTAAQPDTGAHSGGSSDPQDLIEELVKGITEEQEKAKVESLETQLALMRQARDVTVPRVDPAAVMAVLREGTGCAGIEFVTKQTDGNNLLGKPDGYRAKAFFGDPQVPADVRAETPMSVQAGGSAEFFDTPAGAIARALYLNRAHEAGLSRLRVINAEHMYPAEVMIVSGSVVLRLTAKVGEDAAKGYLLALEKSTGQPARFASPDQLAELMNVHVSQGRASPALEAAASGGPRPQPGPGPAEAAADPRRQQSEVQLSHSDVPGWRFTPDGASLWLWEEGRFSRRIDLPPSVRDMPEARVLEATRSQRPDQAEMALYRLDYRIRLFVINLTATTAAYAILGRQRGRPEPWALLSEQGAVLSPQSMPTDFAWERFGAQRIDGTDFSYARCLQPSRQFVPEPADTGTLTVRTDGVEFHGSSQRRAVAADDMSNRVDFFALHGEISVRPDQGEPWTVRGLRPETALLVGVIVPHLPAPLSLLNDPDAWEALFERPLEVARTRGSELEDLSAQYLQMMPPSLL